MSPSLTSDPFLGRITWRPAPWGEKQVFEGRGKSADEAVERCREAAVQAGWRPPRWWQWWRRREPKHPLVSFTSA